MTTPLPRSDPAAGWRAFVARPLLLLLFALVLWGWILAAMLAWAALTAGLAEAQRAWRGLADVSQACVLAALPGTYLPIAAGWIRRGFQIPQEKDYPAASPAGPPEGG